MLFRVQERVVDVSKTARVEKGVREQDVVRIKSVAGQRPKNGGRIVVASVQRGNSVALARKAVYTVSTIRPDLGYSFVDAAYDLRRECPLEIRERSVGGNPVKLKYRCHVVQKELIPASEREMADLFAWRLGQKGVPVHFPLAAFLVLSSGTTWAPVIPTKPCAAIHRPPS